MLSNHHWLQRNLNGSSRTRFQMRQTPSLPQLQNPMVSFENESWIYFFFRRILNWNSFLSTTGRSTSSTMKKSKISSLVNRFNSPEPLNSKFRKKKLGAFLLEAFTSYSFNFLLQVKAPSPAPITSTFQILLFRLHQLLNQNGSMEAQSLQLLQILPERSGHPAKQLPTPMPNLAILLFNPSNQLGQSRFRRKCQFQSQKIKETIKMRCKIQGK